MDAQAMDAVRETISTPFGLVSLLADLAPDEYAAVSRDDAITSRHMIFGSTIFGIDAGGNVLVLPHPSRDAAIAMLTGYLIEMALSGAVINSQSGSVLSAALDAAMRDMVATGRASGASNIDRITGEPVELIGDAVGIVAAGAAMGLSPVDALTIHHGAMS